MGHFRASTCTSTVAGTAGPGRPRGGAARGGADGRLPPGTRLPSSRALAADLGIARNTVAEAYAQLVAEGWLTARAGSGTWVAPTARPTPGRRPPRGPTGDRAPATTCGRARPTCPRSRAPRGSRRPGARWPTPRARPSATATRGAGPSCAPALAGYLARARGVRVTAGPSRGLLRLRAGAGAAVPGAAGRAAARPSRSRSTGTRRTAQIAAGAGLAALALPVDDGGAARRAARATPAAAVLTPAHQFPLGVALAAQRAGRGRSTGRRPGGLIVEDDYDGEFRYDRQPVGAMQALAPDHVVYAGTASKTLAPGLRLAWLVVPAPPARRGRRRQGAGRARTPASSTSSPSPSSSPRAATTGTSARAGSSTAAAATGWSRRCAAARRGVHGLRHRGRPARRGHACPTAERGRRSPSGARAAGWRCRGWRASPLGGAQPRPGARRRLRHARPSTPSRRRWPGSAPRRPRRQQRRHRGGRHERKRRLIHRYRRIKNSNP